MYRREGMDDGSAGLALLVMVLVVAFVVALAALLAATLTELGRIYRAHAFGPTRTARLLWAALAGLLGLWLVAGLLATGTGSTEQAAYLAAWSFFVFVLVIEIVDRTAARDAVGTATLDAAGLLALSPVVPQSDHYGEADGAKGQPTHSHRQHGHRQNGHQVLSPAEWAQEGIVLGQEVGNGGH